MAETRAIIDVDINTSPAARGLRDLQREINSFTSALNRNNAVQATASRQYADQLMRLINSSQMFTAETVRMRTAAGQLDQTLSRGRGTMADFFSAKFIKDGAVAAQVLSLANARAAALQTQFIATGAAANGFRDAIAVRPLQAFNAAAEVANQKLIIHRAMLMQATTHMINFGKNTQWAGRQLMVGFTVPLTIFGAAAGRIFKDIEKELVNFKKVYGDVFTPPEELESNIQAVKELASEYTKYGIAVKDTIALAAQAAAAGARNQDLMDATTQATRLATLGQMEQNQALETTIALQNAFALSGEELAKSINFLNMVENQTVVTLQDLSAAIPRVAPVIKGLGGSVEDLAAMLAAMQEGGVSAEQGANALKSGLASLINPTDRAVESLKKMGINLDAIVQTNRGDLMGVVQDFAQALSTLDQFSRQQALEKVFGKYQYARLGALFNNIIKDGSQASRVMDLAGMSAQDMAASAEKELGTIEAATGVKFTAAVEKFKLAIAPIGEMFLKISIPIINFFTQLAEKFNSLPDFAKKFAALGAIIVGVVIPAGTMFLGLLMNLIGTLVKFGSIIGIAFKGFVTGGIKGAIDAVSQAINYMGLEELDAANAAKQLGSATVFVNDALRKQIPVSAEATIAINQLGGAYGALVARMREAAALSATPGGAFATAGAAAESARRRGGRRPRMLNKGGSVSYFGTGDTVPGTGNTDTVPAMLTPGEFIVNKKATEQNIDLLQAINNGDIQYRNKGGGIAKPGRMFYGARPPGPTPGYMSADDFVAMAMRGPVELENIAAAQAREAGIGLTSISSAMRGSRTSQVRTLADGRRSEDLFRALELKETEGAELLRQAVKLGLTPTELGLKAIGNLTVEMSKSANLKMAAGTLTRSAALAEITASKNAYSPIRYQIEKYFGAGFNDDLFRTLHKAELEKLPLEGITNARFEKATRNALRRYLDDSVTMQGQKVFTKEDRKSFLRDILAQDSVRAGVPKDKILEILAKNGITPRIEGKDIYGVVNGKEYNFGLLTGKTIDRLGRVPGITRYDKIPLIEKDGIERVHANKGGMIPGVQYFGRLPGRPGIGGGKVASVAPRTQEYPMAVLAKAEERAPKSVRGISSDYALTYADDISSFTDDFAKITQGRKVDKNVLETMLSPDVAHKKDRIFGGKKVWWKPELFGTLGIENKGFELLFGRNRKTSKAMWEELVKEGKLSETEIYYLRRFQNGIHPTSSKEIDAYISMHKKATSFIKKNSENDAVKKFTKTKTYSNGWFDGMGLAMQYRKKGKLGGAQNIPVRRESTIEKYIKRNMGGIIPGGVVGKSKNFYGRFNAKTVELFTKWISSFPEDIAATKAKVLSDPAFAKVLGGGFRKSGAKETLERATWMKDLPKAGESISLGSLASFSPKGSPVLQHLADSPLQKNYEKARYWLDVEKRGLEKEQIDLARLRQQPDHPNNIIYKNYRTIDSKNPYKGKNGRGNPDGPEAAIWDLEKGIQIRNKSIKDFEKTVKEYESMNKVVIQVETPKGTIRANLDEIVDPSKQSYRGNQTFEQERILHNANVKISDIKTDESGITRIFAKLESSEYPGFNFGGMIPGVPGYMAGSRVNPVLAMLQRRRAQVAVASGKSLDDIVFARGADKRLNADPSDILTLLLHNKNITNKDLQNIARYHGSRIRNGVFGKFDKELGYNTRDPKASTWKQIADILDEKGYSVIQKRNAGGQIFESGGRAIVPGVGNTDTVPAMLTPGEFVVNKQATSENMDLLRAINGGLTLNKGGMARLPGVQYFQVGGNAQALDDWGMPIKDSSKETEKPKSFIKRFLAKQITPLDQRIAAIAEKTELMKLNATKTGIVMQELLDFEKLPLDQQGKSKNLKVAEKAILEYDKRFTLWTKLGSPVPPIDLSNRAENAVKTGILSNTISPTLTHQPPDIWGYDKDGNPISDERIAANRASHGELYDANGKIMDRPDRSVTYRKGATPPITPEESLASKFQLTRAQKVWAAIAGLTMAGTATGIAINERNKANQDPMRLNQGGGIPGYGNKDTVPAMLTPGEFVINKDATKKNLDLLYAINSGQNIPGYALGGLIAGAAQFALPMALSFLTMPLGAKAGEAVAGETGAMVGGIAGSMLPFMLPWGKMMGRGKGAVPTDGPDTNILKTTTVGKPVAAAADDAAKGIKGTAASIAKVGLGMSSFARMIPLLLNPWTAAAAALVAVAYTLKQLHDSNQAEYEAGRKFADAMTTTTDEIALLGETAKQRSQNMTAYLNQEEDDFIERKFNKKIAEAKTKQDKADLERQKKEAMDRAGGQTTRRETVEAFYDRQLGRKSLTGQERVNMYTQRNLALGAKNITGLNLDQTFGKKFLQGAGKEIFDQFKAVRDLQTQGGVNQYYASNMAQAAYGTGTSISEAAAKDMGQKLSQYVLSGVMTEDEAASVAFVIAQELKDARIGTAIREEVIKNVGADGLRAKYDPASTAMKLAETNEKRINATTKSIESLAKQFYGPGTTAPEGFLAQSALGLLPGQAVKDIVSASRRDDPRYATPLAQQKELIYPTFFSGMADELRREIGAVIELQVSQMQMLEENIAAVGLAYNDMILKADTLREKKDLELEKTKAISRLQEKQNETRESFFAIYGGQQEYGKFVTLQEEQLRGSLRFNQESVMNVQRQDFGQALTDFGNQFDIGNWSPEGIWTNISTAGKVLWEGGDLFNRNLGDTLFRGAAAIGDAVEGTILDPTGGNTFGKIFGAQLYEQTLKRFEGTPVAAALVAMQESGAYNFGQGPESEAWANTFYNMLTQGESFASSLTNAFSQVGPIIDSMSRATNPLGTIDADTAGMMKRDLQYLLQGFTFQGQGTAGGLLTPQGQLETANFVTSLFADLSAGGDNLQRTLDILQTNEFFNGDQAAIAQERWANFFNQIGNMSTLVIKDGKDLLDIFSEDPIFIKMVLTDDEFYKGFMKFTSWLNKQSEQTILAVHAQIQMAEDPTEWFRNMSKQFMSFNVKESDKRLKAIKKSFNQLKNIVPASAEKEIKRLFRAIKSLDDVKDPEIRAKLLAEIDPNMFLLLDAINAYTSDKTQQNLDAVLDLSQDMVLGGRGIAEEEPPKEKKKGGGGTKEDPLGDKLRELRNQVDNQAKQGKTIIATNEKAAGIFDQLRNNGMNLTEAVIDWFKSLDPATALKVGKEVLNDRKKLNTLVSLMSQDAITAMGEAARAAKNNAKFTKEMVSNITFSGMSEINRAQMFGDEEFVRGLQLAVAGAENKQKAARKFARQYMAEQKAQREIQLSMAPTVLRADAAKSMVASQGATALMSGLGLTQEESASAMGNENINLIISEMFRGGKTIDDLSKKQRNSILAWVNSQKTVLGEFDKAVSKVQEGFLSVEAAIQGAIDKIEVVNIQPLQESLDKIQTESSDYAENQRRLQKSLSDLKEKEDALREEQKQKEEEINDAYNLRIDTLEKIDKISKEADQREKDKLTLADALSRGDIAAAARAAQEMQAKAAQARREETIQAVKEQKERDMENLKETHENNLKALTIKVNGELLTREQIENKIKKIEEDIYNNSLLEWDLQKKITKERENQNKLTNNLLAVQRIGTVIEKLSLAAGQESGMRLDEITTAIAELDIIGTPEAKSFRDFIAGQAQQLNVAKTPDEFIKMLQPGLAPFISAAGQTTQTNLNALGNLIPTPVQTAAGLGVAQVQGAIPSLTTELDAFIEKWKNKNPFNIIGTERKKWKKMLLDAFAKFPKIVGTGGGSKDGDTNPPPTDKGEESIYLPPAAQYDDLRKGTISKSQTIEKDGVTYKVTAFYDTVTGKELTHLRKYDVLKKVYLGSGLTYVIDKEDIGASIQQQAREYGALGLSPDAIERRLPSLPQANFPGAVAPPLMPNDPRRNQGPRLTPTDYLPPEIAILSQGKSIERQMRDIGERSGNNIGLGIINGIGLALGSLALFGPIVGPLIGSLAAVFMTKSPSQHPDILKAGNDIAGNADGGIIGGIVQAIKNIPAALFNNFISGIKTLFGLQSGSSTNTGILGVGKNILGGIWNGLKDAALKGPVSLITNVITGIGGSLGIVGGANSTNGGIIGIGGNILGAIWRGLKDAAKGGLGELPGIIIKNIKGILGLVTEGEEDANPIDGIVGIGRGILRGIWKGLTESINPIGFVENVVKTLAGAVGVTIGKKGANPSTNDQIQSVGIGIVGGIWNGVTAWFSDTNIANAIASLKTKMLALFNKFTADKNVAESLGKVGANIWTLIQNGIASVVPQPIKDAISKVGSVAGSGLGFLAGKVAAVLPVKGAFGGFIFKGSTEQAPGMMMGGNVRKFANGSFVPGIGITDKVPALLTPGEFVVRKSVAQTYGPLLQALNGDVFPRINMNRAMPSSSAQNSGSMYNYNVNVTLNGANMNPDDVANAVMQKIKMKESMNIRSYNYRG